MINVPLPKAHYVGTDETRRPWTYICGRCGIVRSRGGSMSDKPPEYCQDCKWMIRQEEVYRRALSDVKCPTCSAEPGRPCRDMRSPNVFKEAEMPHKLRIQESKKLKWREEKNAQRNRMAS